MKEKDRRQHEAAVEYARAYGLDPAAGELFLPHWFNRGRKAVLSNMPAEEERERMTLESSAPHRYLWDFLRDKETQALRAKSEMLRKVYENLGEPGADLYEWWKAGARRALSDYKAQAVYLDWVLLDGDAEYPEATDNKPPAQPGFPTMAIVRIFCVKPIKELVAEFERQLSIVYAKREEEKMRSLFASPSFGKERLHKKAFLNTMAVWRERTANPKRTFFEIARELNLIKSKNDISAADSYSQVTSEMTKKFEEAEALLKLWSGSQNRRSKRKGGKTNYRAKSRTQTSRSRQR